MDDILFLAQRCPYPPNKGDKITTWNVLQRLARTHRVHVGAFIDDPDDWRHEPFLRERFASVCLRPLDRRTGLLRAAGGLLRGEPLSVAFYRDAGMQRWVDDLLARGLRRVFTYSSATARFVLDAPGCRRLMHFADIDSDKWRQYARVSRWPMAWVYAREARLMLAWERRVAAAFDASYFVTEAEVADFRRLAPESAARVAELANGVDADYFSPERDYPVPWDDPAPRLVFTGAMDYRPNVDAVVWFADEVLPRLRQAAGDVRFCIVGSKPAPEVLALAARDGIQVTGRVEDVRPYVAHARGMVAPLRIARGVQNKVLEGMAMAKTVVCSPQGLEGIDATHGVDLWVADGAEAFVQGCTELLAGRLELGGSARRTMLARYAWEARLAPLDRAWDGA